MLVEAGRGHSKRVAMPLQLQTFDRRVKSRKKRFQKPYLTLFTCICCLLTCLYICKYVRLFSVLLLFVIFANKVVFNVKAILGRTLMWLRTFLDGMQF
ncbi:MAG: hypothetical protein JAY75_19645, partial [Candidatus Thiodiazotropha taylori]|nr:hypothetical protein [Candidatus Thiodiazotropha taylori]MCW4310434.1 hypothetical protein [Candidatus Thiodiazotropha endolucinida]